METTASEMKKNNAIRKAKLRVKKLREFYSNVRTYLIVNTVFFILNFIESPGEWWVLYPIIGWGFCLSLHGFDMFNPIEKYDDEWEERKTKELVDRFI